jgi:predicted DNA repair protein MutK
LPAPGFGLDCGWRVNSFRDERTDRMAVSSLLALLDDITSVLDDVATLTKVATGKTAGVLGDDLALNAQQVSGVRADRELPVVWAVAKGSLFNKAILVPAALAISALLPWAITPLLMVGGLFLCYEGFEKIAHRFASHDAEEDAHKREVIEAARDPAKDLVAIERDKIKGAIRTDFILSAEIIVIALGAVAAAGFGTRVGVLVSIALLMTAGVYGLVALIVKLDDIGAHMCKRPGTASRAIGNGIVTVMPYLMKALSIAGTAAMFLVGGGILTHGIAILHHGIEGLAQGVEAFPAIGSLFAALTPMLLNALAGVIAGALVYAALAVIRRMRPARAAS